MIEFSMCNNMHHSSILHITGILTHIDIKQILPNCNSIYKASIITCIGTSQSCGFDTHT